MPDSPGTVTDGIVEFVASADLSSMPPAAKERATAAIADCVGVSYLGADSEVAQRLIDALRDSDGLGGPAPLLGRPETATPAVAALYHGVAAHALDYDDVNHPGPMHPSCHLVPALLSAASVSSVDGRSFIEAYVVGFEIDAKLAVSMNPGHYDAGWHTTGTFGAVASGAAVAKLLGLDHLTTEHALSLAASSASGLRGNIGSMAKPLHAGNAARSGFIAAILARRGFTGMQQIFDRKHGYLQAFGDGPDAYAERLGTLGAEWEIATEFGLGLKPWPCCGEATSVIEAALSLRNRIDSEDIVEILAYTNAHSTRILVYPHPTTTEQARFSLPYCFAAAFIEGRATEDIFAAERICDDSIQRLMRKVRHVVSPEHGGEREYGAHVVVHGRDNVELIADVPVTKGWSTRFLTREEQETKFVTCTQSHLAEDDARTLNRQLHDLESASDVAKIFFLPTNS